MKRNGILRFCSLALACLMMVGLIATPVFAAGNDPVLVDTKGAITLDATAVEGADMTGHTYNVYKVLDKYSIGSDDEGNALYQYKPTTQFMSFSNDDFGIDAANGKITTKKDLTIDGTTYPAGTVVNDTFTNMDKPTQGLAGYFGRAISLWAYANGTPDKTMANGQTATELTYGYYLILEDNEKSSEDNLEMIMPTLVNLDSADKAVTLKAAMITLEKTVYDAEETAAAIGEVLPYRIETVTPLYATNVDPDTVSYVLTDDMSEGLTLDESSVNVTIDGNDVTSDVSIEATVGEKGTSLVIDVPGSLILANPNKAVVVTYDALVNEKALYNQAPADTNNNIVTLEYSRNPGVTEDKEDLDDECLVYTYSVDLRKLDGAHETLLPGAKFTLERAAQEVKRAAGGEAVALIKTDATDVDEYRPAKEGETGITEFTTTDKEIRFIGLAPDTYYLTETAAPAGYSKIADPLRFTITAEVDDDGKLTGAATVSVGSEIMTLVNDESSVDVGYITADGVSNVNLVIKNFEGITLPSTGSLTSILVMGGGAAVVLGGGAFLFARRKKDDEDED